METETWYIEYEMQTPTEVVRVREAWPCTKGYHERYLGWCKEHNFNPEGGPLSKVRPHWGASGYTELLSLFEESPIADPGGRYLPLEQRAELTNGRLLCSENNPITLIAPDGVRYISKS